MSWNAYTRYQKRKATAIAAYLIQGIAASNYVTLEDLPTLAANFSMDEWRTISFAAGQPVAEEATKNYCVAILLTLSAKARAPLPALPARPDRAR